MEILWKGTVSKVSGDLPENLRKLSLSTKFPNQEIPGKITVFYAAFLVGSERLSAHWVGTREATKISTTQKCLSS